MFFCNRTVFLEEKNIWVPIAAIFMDVVISIFFLASHALTLYRQNFNLEVFGLGPFTPRVLLIILLLPPSIALLITIIKHRKWKLIGSPALK